MIVDNDGSGKRPVLLETRHLTREVDSRRLVDDISIRVAPGEVLAIVGPSGAGKSSFLRLLNRLDEPTEGTVLFKGKDYREIPPRRLRQQVGMVMQAANLFPGTVADNLRFGPKQRGETLSDDAIATLLVRVSLSEYANRDIANLSGGEAQRVSLARALANQPEVLLLDEPTSALDPAAEQEVEATLRRVIEDQALTCLIVTHDREQAARLATHALLLQEGRLVQAGPVSEVIHA